MRFLLAGSYGMNCVKWLRRIELLETPGGDFFMNERFRRVSNGAAGVFVADMQVKSIIVKPKPSAVLRGESIAAGGYAWAGPEEIARVELAIDSGPWRPARLLATSGKYAWTPWGKVQVRAAALGNSAALLGAVPLLSEN